MNPWLLFIGPIMAVVLPWTIPFLLIIALWQATEGGELVGADIVARRMMRDPAQTALHNQNTRGPLRFDNDMKGGVNA